MKVLGHGPRDAKIVIVGEAPGQQEEAQGLPFVGGSGQLLTQMLSAAGIDRNQCYLTNVSKLRPPSNEFGVFYNDKQRREPSEYLRQCWTELGDELKTLKPNVICLAGGEALRAVTGRFGIDKWRGSILQTPFGKAVPTLHPAYVFRMYQARPVVELDLRRVSQESTTPDIRLPNTKFDINPSFERVCQYLTGLSGRVSFDIETTGRMVRCLGLSSEDNHAICIPFISNPNSVPQIALGRTIIPLGPEHGGTPTSHWSAAQEYEIARLLDKMFRDPSIEKVAQNFPFDSVILAREYGFSFCNLHMDTMLAHHTCYCELPKGLDFLTSIYTRWPYYSDYDVSDDTQTWVYCSWDAMVTREISFRLDRELVECGVRDYYYAFKHQPMLALTRTETRGILVDQEKRSKKAEESRQKKSRLEVQIQAAVGVPGFNPDSDKQVKDYLYGTLGLAPMFHKKTKQPTTDKEARRKLAIKYPQVKQILELFDQHSVESTLLSGLLQKPLGLDGRIRTHYNPAGTDTDRLASSEPLFDPGTNLQNVHKGEIRSIFIADPGWNLIKADLSQAEFRIVAWYAKIKHVIERYARDPNWDVHTWVASLIFKKPESEITRDKGPDGKPSERDIAKNGVYGGNYAMHYKTAAATYKISEELARFVLDSYRAAIPEIPAWWLEVQRTVNTSRRLDNPLGRKRLCFDRVSDDLYRTAYSDLAQSVVAGIINRAVSLSDERFPEEECWPCLQVHDEIVYQVRCGFERKYAAKVRSILEYPIKFPEVDQPLVIPADVKVGPNWHDVKPLKLEV